MKAALFLDRSVHAGSFERSIDRRARTVSIGLSLFQEMDLK